MDSTQAGKEEPDPTKPRRLGKSIIAFGAAPFLFSIVAAFFTDGQRIDFGLVILAVLGVYVIKGSRRAAKWALALTTIYLLTGCILLAILISGNVHWLKVDDRAMKASEVVWAGPLLAVFALWALANLVGLYRYLVASRPAWVKEKPTVVWMVVPVALVLVVLGLFLALPAVKVWRLPDYAKPAAIEARYPQQLTWLRHLASDSEARGHKGTVYYNQILELFALPEILEVKLQTSESVYPVIAHQPHYDVSHASSYFSMSPRPGRRVVNTATCKLANGATLKTATYEAKVIDDKGDSIGYSLTFDLKKLEEASKPPNDQAPQ